MVNSLEALVLYSVPIAVLVDLLQAVWHFPLRKACVSVLFQRSNTDEFASLAKTLPWDHPIARTLGHEVHRRKMAGKSCRVFFFSLIGMGPFPYTFFLGSRRCSPISTFVGKSFGPSTFAFVLDDVDWIGLHVFGSQDVGIAFFLRFLDYPRGPTHLPYLPVGSPPHR